MSIQNYCTVLVSALFLFVSRSHGEDTLAADAAARKYRTGKIDERVVIVPDSLNAGVFKTPRESLPELVKFLTDDTRDEFQKVKRIHDWIDFHIAYDGDLLRGISDEGSRRPYEFLPLKRTTCSGYSGLFQEMARLAGLDAVSITGHSKTYFLKKQKRLGRHVWSAVQLGGTWYVLDVTADKRLSYRAGVTGPRGPYSDRNLFLSPDAKLLVNLPLDDKFQYTKFRITFQEFTSMPRVRLNYFRYGVKYELPEAELFRDGRKDFEDAPGLESLFDEVELNSDTLEIPLRVPRNVLVRTLVALEQKQEDEITEGGAEPPRREATEEQIESGRFFHSIAENRGDKILARFSPASPGLYRAYIQAKFLDDPSDIFRTIHDFRIRARKSGVLLPDKKDTLYSNNLQSFLGLKILSSSLDTADGFSTLDVQIPDGVSMASSLYDAENHQIRDSATANFLPDRVRLYFGSRQPGNFFLRLMARHVSGSHKMETFALARIEQNAPAAALPPEGEIFYEKRFYERGFKVVSEDVSTWGGHARVNIQVPEPLKVSCKLSRAEGTAVPGGCVTTRSSGKAAFSFKPSDAGIYTGRIFQDGSRKETILYFRIKKQ